MTRSGDRLLNYTTSIEAEKSANEIEYLLGKAGATDIHKEYENGHIKALSFGINIANQTYLNFRMPINTEGTMQVFNEQVRKGKLPKSYYDNQEQARRTAWRTLKDWVEVQIAFIEAKQVEIQRAFFAYILNGKGQTLFECVANNGFRALLPEHTGEGK